MTMRERRQEMARAQAALVSSRSQPVATDPAQIQSHEQEQFRQTGEANSQGAQEGTSDACAEEGHDGDEARLQAPA